MNVIIIILCLDLNYTNILLQKKYMKYCIKNKIIYLQNYFRCTTHLKEDLSTNKIEKYIYVLKCIFKYYDIYCYYYENENNIYEKLSPKDAKKMCNRTYEKYKDLII